MKIEYKLLSSLAKVFTDEEPTALPEGIKLSGFMNETVSFQLAVKTKHGGMVRLKAESQINEYINIRAVRAIPVTSHGFSEEDDYYVRKGPGLYPDRLEKLRHGWIYAPGGEWHTYWIDVEPGAAAGVYPVKLIITMLEPGLYGKESKPIEVVSTSVEILGAELPKQELRHTKWFHADCLAEYYDVDMFSERHWQICEDFIKTATKRGINLILTPILTPALDTMVGGERLTTQLVDVTVTKGKYSFGFEKLDRWIKMCLRNDVEYFEFAHLVTQWGAKHAPKVMATVDGQYKRIFGWETDSLGEDYKAFMGPFLTELTSFLRGLGLTDRCYFHISDEPGLINMEEDLAQYTAFKDIISPYIKGFKTIDALSNLKFYQNGAVDRPIPSLEHVQPFLDAKVKGLWVYYTGGHEKNVSNLSIAMPSSRNRILGLQLYKYDIEGFLHWGYNYYNSWLSVEPINPYTSADVGLFGFGGTHQVYPGPDGKPEETLRLMVSAQFLYDLRALKLLESLTDKDFVVGLIDEGLTEPVTFTQYPREDEYILGLRQRVNTEIMKRI
ncbi:MAG: DUF4091 domain-containing protein [Defluviitaleaceae bacterium]|nr:DUF4091 domain-containing protein [Defluviitaleaceae bacterium]